MKGYSGPGDRNQQRGRPKGQKPAQGNRYDDAPKSTQGGRYGDTPRPAQGNRYGDAPRAAQGNRYGDAPRPAQGNRYSDAPRAAQGNRYGDAPRPAQGNASNSRSSGGKGSTYEADRREAFRAPKPVQGGQFGDAPKPMRENRYGDAPRPAQGNRYGDAPRPAQGNRYGDAPRPAQGTRYGDAPRSAQDNHYGDVPRPAQGSRYSNTPRPARGNRYGDTPRSDPMSPATSMGGGGQYMQEPMAPPENLLYGRNSVREALKSGRSVMRMLVMEGMRTETTVRVLVAMAVERNIPVVEVERQRLENMCAGGHHQGVALVASMKDYVSLDDLLQVAKEKNQPPLLLALDGIEDPHNLGALLRVCECAGVHGVIIPKHRAVGLTPAVMRTSSGAGEYVPVAQVTNMARTLTSLKEQGLWVLGAQMGAPTIYQSDCTVPTVLVIGGEGKGLSKLVSETCDGLVSLPILGQIGSLNAATAGAALVYEIVRQRSAQGQKK